MTEPDRMIDPAVLTTLTKDFGGDDIVIELVEMFLGELPGRVVEIIDGDDDSATRAAHTLKSSAQLLGALPLADACSGIENDRAPTTGVSALATATDEALRAWLADRQ